MADVAVYARISDDREGLRKGVDRQLPLCRTYCKKNNLTIADEYVDNDISASRKTGGRTRQRPNYRAMYERIRDGHTTTIVVWHLDRLYRNMRELEELIDLVEATKVRIRTVAGGDFDLNTSDGRAMARVIVAFNMKESEDKSRRILAKHQELAEQGRRPGGGTRQFGYADPMTIDPGEAELVRDAARRVLAGESVRSVCADWARRGVLSVTGRAWTQTVLRRLLCSASIAGLREHKGIVTPGVWPAIIDVDTHERLRAVLLDPGRRTNVHARRYLLAGFLVCGRCGARMVARPKGDKRRGYVCASGPSFHGCGRMGALAEPLERIVERVLFEGVDSSAVRKAVRRRAKEDDEQALVDEIGRDQAALEQVARDHYVDRVIGPAQFAAATQALEARIAAARRRLVRREASGVAESWVGRGVELADAWPGMDLSQRRAILGTYVESVVLAPAVPGRNWFDDDRLVDPKRGPGVKWRTV